MGYATFTPIQTLTKTIYNSTSETDYNTLASQAMENADDFITTELEEYNVTPPVSDDTLTKSANYLAAAEIIDAYHAAKDNRSPTATSYEDKGVKLITKYIAIYENTTDTTPYKTVGTYSYDKDYPRG